MSQLVSLNELNKHVEPSQFILELSEMCKANCTFKEIAELCAKRIDDTSLIHSSKTHLAHVTKMLLKHEEKKIEQILK